MQANIMHDVLSHMLCLSGAVCVAYHPPRLPTPFAMSVFGKRLCVLRPLLRVLRAPAMPVLQGVIFFLIFLSFAYVMIRDKLTGSTH
jgi:hypothetical protein